MEIEKKFLLRKVPKSLESYEKKEMEQGYLCTDPVVRIRRSNEDYILTYKSRMGMEQVSDGDVRVNHEVEMPLTRQGYEHLREKIDGNLIKKSRYLIPLDDSHVGELDVFEGALKGLSFIEVEFSDKEDARAFEPPEWFGENVSDDHRYSNSFLSRCTDLSVFAGEIKVEAGN